MDALTQVPSTIPAGTTITYTRTFSDYPASGGWSLTVVLAGPGTLKVSGTPSGADFLVTLTAAQTAKLPAGTYRYAERVKKGAEEYDTGRGEINVLADPFTAAPGDLRTREEKMLDVVDRAIEGTLEAGMESFQIAGRAVKYFSPVELLALRSQLASAISAGKSGRISRTHLIRFSQPDGGTR